MAQLKEITLNDVRKAFDAGKAHTTINRGGGRIDRTETHLNSEVYLSKVNNLKGHLSAEKKAAKEAAKK